MRMNKLQKEIKKLEGEENTLVGVIDYIEKYADCPLTVECLKFRLKEVKQILKTKKQY